MKGRKRKEINKENKVISFLRDLIVEPIFFFFPFFPYSLGPNCVILIIAGIRTKELKLGYGQAKAINC